MPVVYWPHPLYWHVLMQLCMLKLSVYVGKGTSLSHNNSSILCYRGRGVCALESSSYCEGLNGILSAYFPVMSEPKVRCTTHGLSFVMLQQNSEISMIIPFFLFLLAIFCSCFNLALSSRFLFLSSFFWASSCFFFCRSSISCRFSILVRTFPADLVCLFH